MLNVEIAVLTALAEHWPECENSREINMTLIICQSPLLKMPVLVLIHAQYTDKMYASY